MAHRRIAGVSYRRVEDRRCEDGSADARLWCVSIADAGEGLCEKQKI
jgi:hypothetical protein